jgi:hypothetical protein
MERLTRRRWLSAAAVTLAAVAWLFGMLPSRPAGSSEMGILVPAYFYPSPGGVWSRLRESASRVPVTAILNPASGPGNTADANFSAAVDALRDASGTVVGYVHTQYGLRPLEQVTEEIDRYADWYDIDGIFVDEMSASGAVAVLAYYEALYAHIKSADAEWEVIGNPGTNIHESHLLRPTADRFVVTENAGAAYPGFMPPPWHADYDASRFAHLIHSEPSATTMAEDVQLARSRNAGLIYITDDVLPNPWNRLPIYWDAEVATIVAQNQMATAGDYDGSGRVDQADLDLVLLHWGDVGPDPPAGWTGPPPMGIVDQAELDAVLFAWGATPAAEARIEAAAPEPRSLALLSLLLLALGLILIPDSVVPKERRRCY